MRNLLIGLLLCLPLDASAAPYDTIAAWNKAIELSMARPDEIQHIKKPDQVVIYDAIRLIPALPQLGRLCGQTQNAWLLDPQYHNHNFLTVEIWTLPSEFDLRYLTLIHEFLHAIGWQLGDLRDDAYAGDEYWVLDRMPLACPNPPNPE